MVPRILKVDVWGFRSRRTSTVGGRNLNMAAVAWAGGETRPDSPLHLFPQSWAAGWSCLSAATAEGAERVRVGADRVRVGGGRCCSPNIGAESDSSANEYFRDHLVVLISHVIPFPRDETVLRSRFDGSPPNRH
jgi:hypothetical protein